jgi:hypothetical protein
MNKDVQRFLDGVSGEQRPLFEQLHTLIMGLYPEPEVGISYGIPTYKAKSGRVGLGLWKGGVTLHTYGARELVEEFRARCPAFKTTTAGIDFRVSDKIPLAAVKKVIKLAIERPRRR